MDSSYYESWVRETSNEAKERKRRKKEFMIYIEEGCEGYIREL